MERSSLMDYIANLYNVEEAFPFGDDVLVYKIGGKIFALINTISFETINLKCNPERAVMLREKYPEIVPGYHMNKKHWNTVYLTGGLTDAFIKELILHSYELVKGGLPKRVLENLNLNG